MKWLPHQGRRVARDEMRVGQKNKLTHRRARKGTRPRATHDQRTQFDLTARGGLPRAGAGAAVVLPVCNTDAMQFHLDEIPPRSSPVGVLPAARRRRISSTGTVGLRVL